MFDKGTVHFKSIKKTDEGQFLCEASNGIGSGLSKVVQVKVNGKRKWNVEKSQMYL